MAKEPGAAGGNPPAGPAAGEAGAAGKPAAYRYRCREACTFMKRYWGEGEVAVLPAKTDNRHFELVG
jgi:hypothetical protein